MKRYLTIIFVLLAVATLFIGLRFEARWSGIASWGIAFILFIFAAYFTKYIPNGKRAPK